MEHLVYWILGILATGLLSLLGIVYKALRADLDRLEIIATDQVQKSAVMEEKFRGVNDRLGRIESKLDRLLERSE